MSLYDDTFRAGIAEDVAGVLEDLEADGVTMTEQAVATVTEVTTGADPARGVPGARVATAALIVPRPRVRLGQIFRTRAGVVAVVADAELKIPRHSLTRARLDAAAYWTIDSVKYSLAEGGVKQGPIFWVLLLNRS